MVFGLDWTCFANSVACPPISPWFVMKLAIIHLFVPFLLFLLIVHVNFNFCSLAVLITLDWIEHLLGQTDPSCHPDLSRTAIGSCGNSNSIILLAVKFKRYEFMFWCLARLVHDLCGVIFTPFLPSYFKFKINKLIWLKKHCLFQPSIQGKLTGKYPKRNFIYLWVCGERSNLNPALTVDETSLKFQ